MDCKQIRDNYPRQECPDCNEDIPADIPNGTACANCGHVFWQFDILENQGQPLGVMNIDGQIVVSWQSQGWSLPAPPVNGEPRKYLPCDQCCKLEGQPLNVVSFCCDDCAVQLQLRQA